MNKELDEFKQSPPQAKKVLIDKVNAIFAEMKRIANLLKNDSDKIEQDRSIDNENQ